MGGRLEGRGRRRWRGEKVEGGGECRSRGKVGGGGVTGHTHTSGRCSSIMPSLVGAGD